MSENKAADDLVAHLIDVKAVIRSVLNVIVMEMAWRAFMLGIQEKRTKEEQRELRAIQRILKRVGNRGAAEGG